MGSWSSREELEDAVVAYQPHWWRSDHDALEIIDDRIRHPGLRERVLATSALGQIVTTTDIYRPASSGARPDRPFLPQRQAIHAAIVDQCVPPDPGKAAIDTSAGTPSPPDVYFTIGCPGAGKTSVLRAIVDRRRDTLAHDAGLSGPEPYSIIDADRVRQLLPEYADGLGAFVVEQECYNLTYGEVFDRALARRADIVYDTIGRLTSMRDNLQLLSDEGYRVHLLHAVASLDDCALHTERRALEVDGRLVPTAMLERWAEEAAETIAALRREGFPLASWASIDTSDMDAPALIDGTAPWSEQL